MTGKPVTAHPGAPAIVDGPRPKHAQLSDLLADLAATELGPGAAIPSERELMATYDLSRATVRKAIESLISSGLLYRVPAKGTFVARPRLESNLHLASFSQDMRRRGRVPSTRLLAVEEDQPPADVADALGLGPGGAAWRVHRVRLADDQPVAEENGWYPTDAFPDLDHEDLTGSLYEVFARRYGLAIDRAEQTLWGECADAGAGQTARGAGRHTAARLPPRLVGRRPAGRARRLALPRRPVPAAHEPRERRPGRPRAPHRPHPLTERRPDATPVRPAGIPPANPRQKVKGDTP